MTKRTSTPKPYATLIALAIVAVYYFVNSNRDQPELGEAAYTDGQMIEAQGVVTRVLPDDTDGSRHQRFILRLDDEATLLVAHNIDLAPRVKDLAVGDVVRFRGQYETNNRGGLVHWTHDDPRGERGGGWLEHKGQRYQ